MSLGKMQYHSRGCRAYPVWVFYDNAAALVYMEEYIVLVYIVNV